MTKLLSLIISIGYLIIAYHNGGTKELFRFVIFLVLPLACIWFSNEIGGYTGSARLTPITSESPGCLIRLIGWFLLFLPIIMALINASHLL